MNKEAAMRLVVEWFVLKRLANQGKQIDLLLDIACNRASVSKSEEHYSAYMSVMNVTRVMGVRRIREMCEELKQIAEAAKDIEPIIINNRCVKCGRGFSSARSSPVQHIKRSHHQLVDQLIEKIMQMVKRNG